MASLSPAQAGPQGLISRPAAIDPYNPRSPDGGCLFKMLRSLLDLPGRGPLPAADLAVPDLADRLRRLAPGDPRLLRLIPDPEAPGDPDALSGALPDALPDALPEAFANLIGAAGAWAQWPEGMDFLDPQSPIHAQKVLERDLYLRRWGRWLDGLAGARILDLGCGIGRFALPMLARGCEVELVDPDPESLRRAVLHAARQGAGRLDAHWTTGEALPELAPVGAVIAAEVLCYVEDPAAILDRLARLLEPSGLLLLSVEARWGWGLSLDAPAAADQWLGSDRLHLAGDRSVQTYSEASLRALLAGWEILDLQPTHYTWSGPFELLARDLATPADLDALIGLEERLRNHPISAPLHRAWTAVARRGGTL